MAVSLPTAADVRKVREQAYKNATDRAELVRTPLLAVLGAGDLWATTVTRAVTTARTRAVEQADVVQQRVAELPALRNRLSADDLRRVLDDLRVQAEQAYAGLAERGEKAWGRIRKQRQVADAIATIEDYTEKLDARVDDFVDDAHDAAENVLTTVTRQTRSTGERVARATQRFSGRAADTVAEASVDASQTVAEKGGDVAAAIDEAGDEAATTARSTSRKAASRTAPKTAPKAANRKPAARRNGNSTKS